MAIEPFDAQACQFAGATVNRWRTLDSYTKFVFFQTGGNIGMSIRVHVWIYPQGNIRHHALFGRNLSEYFQLRFRFDVKTKNTYVQRACHFRPCFAHTREHNSLGLAARAQHPLQLTRSEEHTSELQSRENLVCRLLPEKKKNKH